MGNRDMRRRILSEGAIPFQIQPNMPVQTSGLCNYQPDVLNI